MLVPFSSDDNNEITSEVLAKEIEKAETALKKKEEKLLIWNEGSTTSEDDASCESPVERLVSLGERLERLELSREVSKWQKIEQQEGDDGFGVAQDAERCIQLGDILCRHHADRKVRQGTRRTSVEVQEALDVLFSKEYLPLYQFTRSRLLNPLRDVLRTLGYPSQVGCARVAHEFERFEPRDNDNNNKNHNNNHNKNHNNGETNAASCCYWLERLQIHHENLMKEISHSDSATGRTDSESVRAKKLDVVTELCRPLVERVRFHFLVQDEERVTTTRIDRLPEWLLTYIREQALEEGGPWQLVSRHLSPIATNADRLLSEFLDELCQLAIAVLRKRNFFRHEKVAGPKSNPILACGAIEQLFLFDSHIRSLAPTPITTSALHTMPASLSQSLISHDECLWEWWLERERESAVTTLFDTSLSEHGSIRIEGIPPRAELFCALIHSIRSKAALFASSGPYISRVAVPLCQHFLDAIHEAATQNRSLLTQRRLISLEDLERNLLEWIDLINGAHLVAMRMIGGESVTTMGGNDRMTTAPPSSMGVDHDLARVGRSMERLRDAMIDECSTALVETVMMERAKLASYILRCSHLLMTSSAKGNDEAHADVSPDLQDTITLYRKIMAVCDFPSAGDAVDEISSVVAVAPVSIRTNVTNRLADKFLEVSLDAHGMTPELVLEGSVKFRRDVEGVFSCVKELPPFTMRLMDIVLLMTIDAKSANDLRMALLGLVQSPHTGETSRTISFASFANDGLLMDEARSMLHAKGFSWIHLDDAISVLNRRDDIATVL